MASKGPKPVVPIAMPKAPVAKVASGVPTVKSATDAAKPVPVAARILVAAEPAPAAIIPEAVIPTVEPAVAAATATIQKDADTMEATVNSAADQARRQAGTLFADANDRARNALEKGSKLIEDMNDFSKGNIEAVVESGRIAARGAEDIARYTGDYVRATVEKANAGASQFAAVKSPTEFFKLQNELAKQAMDSVMAETARFTEGYVKLLGEIAQPISNRVAVAVDKVKLAA